MSGNIRKPDYEEMLNQTERIKDLARKVLLLDLEIKADEARITKDAMTDTSKFINGKAPSMDYIKSTVRFTGWSGELLTKRTELVNLETELDKAKLTFQVMKSLVDMYITESANHRASIL